MCLFSGIEPGDAVGVRWARSKYELARNSIGNSDGFAYGDTGTVVQVTRRLVTIRHPLGYTYSVSKADIASGTKVEVMKRREDEIVEAAAVYEAKPKSKMELARGKLTREVFERMKAEGKTDVQIMRELEIENWRYYAIKKELGLTGQVQKKQHAEPKPHEQAGSFTPDSPVSCSVDDPGEGFSGGEDQKEEDKLRGYLFVEVLKEKTENLQRRLEALESRYFYTLDAVNKMTDELEQLTHDYRHHRHQVGAGHWSGKPEG
ncbi:MAG: hypothetical protein AB1510_02215 [Bacillota bacterium]